MATKNNKNIIFYITSIIVLVLVCLSLYFMELVLYSYVTLVLLVLLIISLIIYLFFISNRASKFKRKVKKILKTYNSNLVKIEEIPNFNGKEIKEVESLDDLIGKQVDSSSISYIQDKLSVIFLLINDTSVYYYVMKEKYDVLNLVEEELKKVLYNNENADLDGDVLKELEKTTIISLPNVGTYKISPVRDKKNIEEAVETTMENNIEEVVETTMENNIENSEEIALTDLDNVSLEKDEIVLDDVVEISNEINEEVVLEKQDIIDKPEIIGIIDEVVDDKTPDDCARVVEIL